MGKNKMLRILKWVGMVLGGILGVLGLAGGIFFVKGKSEATAIMNVSPPIKMVEADSASIARGEHLVNILSCHVCHGEQLEGQVMVDVPPFRAVASNLTPAGVGGKYTDTDWDRSLRYGVKPTGQKMIVMPSTMFHSLSDRDASAIIGYLKSLPAVENPLPETEFRPPLFLIAGAPGPDIFSNVPEEGLIRNPAPEAGPTEAYGKYLASISCMECHGQTLQGGPNHEPGAPDVPALAAASRWPLEDFKTALRTGKTPYGTDLRTQYMPWSQSYRHLTDMEVEALYKFISSLGL